ncbi:hypothetical protein [Ferviditalea candida]|uniref:Uncharacterized protein n=1 Tax=Ferviditalea candida TaxID=3108399 RepID=A0ABU5ZJI8_9BACL|nr:hypothetical protein [Paenibacillaceae bacterium T2]
MKNFAASSKGTVTVYLIIIIAAVFAFTSVLIDFARIKLAEHESEDALKSGVRSALSAYDQQLKSYGLFASGLSPEREKQLVGEIAALNLSTGLNGEHSWRMADTRMQASSLRVDRIYSLADQIVFKRQILEQMKYRTPIDYVSRVVNKLRDSKDAAHAANEFAQLNERLEKLIGKRENLLEQAWKKSSKMMDYLHDASGRYRNQLNLLAGITEELRGTTKERLSGELRQLAGIIPGTPEQAAALQAQLIHISTLLRKYDDYDRLVVEVRRASGTELQQLTNWNSELNGKLDQAYSVDADISQEISNLKQQTKSSTGPQNAFEVFQHVEVLGISYFEKEKSGTAAVLSSFGRFAQMLTGDPLQLSDLRQSNEAFRIQAGQWQADSDQAMNLRRKRLAELKKQQEEQSKKAGEQMEKAKAQSMITACGKNDRSVYQQLTGDSGLYRYYMDRDYSTAWALPEPDPSSALQLSPEAYGSSAFQALSGLMDVMEQVRDEVFVNEYALEYFNYRTFSSHQNAGVNSVRTDPAIHSLQDQENEYVLYGLPSCEANQGAAYAEIYLLRLAVRTAEALSDPKKVAEGSPLLVFLTALADGSSKASGDMKVLLEGESVPFMNNWKATELDYKDYIRLFLLMHSKEKNKLSRIQALIHLNTGIDLADKATYIRVAVRSDVSLWFIPQVMSMVKMIGALDGSRGGNRYEFNQTIAGSY